MQALGLGPEGKEAPSQTSDLSALAPVEDDRRLLGGRQIETGLDLGQAGGEVRQARQAEVDNGELDESTAHGRSVALQVLRSCKRWLPRGLCDGLRNDIY